MNNNNNRSLNLSKSLDNREAQIIARNLDRIEALRNNSSQNRQREREEEKLAKQRELSEKRINEARERSLRRENEEREAHSRRMLRQEQEHSRMLHQQEEDHARAMNLIAAQQYENELGFQQEMQRKKSAPPYSEYDPNDEYYYYYDEYGDYLTGEEARDRWQRENCKSYKHYDPDDKFWQYFTDTEGQLIDRQTAFGLWERENCPSYEDYDEFGVWTIYRDGEDFIPKSQARQKWIEKNPDNAIAKILISNDVTEKIKEVYENGTVSLPDIAENINNIPVPYPESMTRPHPDEYYIEHKGKVLKTFSFILKLIGYPALILSGIALALDQETLKIDEIFYTILLCAVCSLVPLGLLFLYYMSLKRSYNEKDVVYRKFVKERIEEKRKFKEKYISVLTKLKEYKKELDEVKNGQWGKNVPNRVQFNKYYSCIMKAHNCIFETIRLININKKEFPEYDKEYFTYYDVEFKAPFDGGELGAFTAEINNIQSNNYDTGSIFILETERLNIALEYGKVTQQMLSNGEGYIILSARLEHLTKDAAEKIAELLRSIDIDTAITKKTVRFCL